MFSVCFLSKLCASLSFEFREAYSRTRCQFHRNSAGDWERGTPRTVIALGIGLTEVHRLQKDACAHGDPHEKTPQNFAALSKPAILLPAHPWPIAPGSCRLRLFQQPHYLRIDGRMWCLDKPLWGLDSHNTGHALSNLSGASGFNLATRRLPAARRSGSSRSDGTGPNPFFLHGWGGPSTR